MAKRNVYSRCKYSAGKSFSDHVAVLTADNTNVHAGNGDISYIKMEAHAGIGDILLVMDLVMAELF